MPAKSSAQRSYLFSKFGAAWVRKHHFDTKGKLPAHVDKRGKGDKPDAVARQLGKAKR